MKKIDRLRNETYQDMKRLLDKYGKCAVIRPTGFGKTGILTRLIKSEGYLRSLGVIRFTEEDLCMSLSSNLENYIETGGSNIFMFKTDLADECYVYIFDSIKELVFDNNSSEDCNFDDDLNKIIDSTVDDLTDAVVVGLSKFLDVK